MDDVAIVIAEKYRALSGAMNETFLSLWAAVGARNLEHGGVSTVSREVGLSRTTIYAGLSELDPKRFPHPPKKSSDSPRAPRVRSSPGGGQKNLSTKTSRSLAIWMPSWTQYRREIRCRRSAGPAKVQRVWRTS